MTLRNHDHDDDHDEHNGTDESRMFFSRVVTQRRARYIWIVTTCDKQPAVLSVMDQRKSD